MRPRFLYHPEAKIIWSKLSVAKGRNGRNLWSKDVY